jgi:hypothetical protein
MFFDKDQLFVFCRKKTDFSILIYPMSTMTDSAPKMSLSERLKAMKASKATVAAPTVAAPTSTSSWAGVAQKPPTPPKTSEPASTSSWAGLAQKPPTPPKTSEGVAPRVGPAAVASAATTTARSTLAQLRDAHAAKLKKPESAQSSKPAVEFPSLSSNPKPSAPAPPAVPQVEDDQNLSSVWLSKTPKWVLEPSSAPGAHVHRPKFKPSGAPDPTQDAIYEPRTETDFLFEDGDDLEEDDDELDAHAPASGDDDRLRVDVSGADGALVAKPKDDNELWG